MLFISATNTNIGKTYTAVKIIHYLGKLGYKVGACKLIETGVKDEPIDAKKLLVACQQYNPSFKNLTPFDISAYTFSLPAAPYCADTKKIISINKLKQKIFELKKISDILIIEGAGGLFVPILQNYFFINFIKEMHLKTLLITPSYLGCINETLLSIKALEDYNINFRWCVNFYKEKEHFLQATKPFYDSYFHSWYTLEEFIQKELLSFLISHGKMP